jgi:tetratricopeptide (TPR) repeat protein
MRAFLVVNCQSALVWLALRSWQPPAGKYDETLAAMSAASDREDKTEKHPVTPGPLAPARELYGTMLLDRGMAKEALAAFEAALKKEPNRLGATLGAGAAAERSGDSAKAREHYAAAVALKTRRIGLLTRKTDASVATQIDAFRQGLGDLGWVEGKSIIIEHRDAEGEFDRLRVLAAEFVGLHMDVIVTVDTPPTKAAQQATKAIPIVIAVSADPVGAGLVSSRSGYSSRNIRHEQPTLAIYGYGPNLGPCSHFNAQIAAPLRFIQKNGQVIQKILKGIVV